MPRAPIFLFFLVMPGLILQAACDRQEAAVEPPPGHRQDKSMPCDEDNGGLILPDEFCAGIVADNLGFIRHLAVNHNGDIYVTMRNRRLNLGGLLGLRDIDQDGRMDRIEKISDIPGMGVAVRGDYLYFASDQAIYRYRLSPGELVPRLPPQVIVRDLPEQPLHGGKPFALDDGRWLYVNIGSPSNACQVDDRLDGRAGLDPCPELVNQAGIWRFAADVPGQTQVRGGYHYARGIRNAYAIDWHPVVDRLYVVQHGRDQLQDQWPELYTEEQGAKLPAEEFLQIEEGADYGWPYCYFDQLQGKRLLAPEYGGDGKTVGPCDRHPPPLIAFPGHYGPNDMKFYAGDHFPARYRNGAFIAFHGSYNRGPFEQVGYQVIFVPFAGDRPAGQWEVFIDGFAGTENVMQPEDAAHRPTGLAIGPDGSLYVADSVQGRIWRILHAGGQPPTAADRP